MLKNGALMQLTQIAGFLPRMITSSEDLTKYKAGDYLGMIKFGSRIDLLIPEVAPNKSRIHLLIQKGQCLQIGQPIGFYQ